MQTNWLDVLDLADDYWELEALQDLCSDCTRLSREVAEDIVPQLEDLAVNPEFVPILSTAASESYAEPWKLPLDANSRSVFKGKPQRLRWTAEEDKKLAKLAKVYKKDWTKIAEHFASKPPHSLAKRWSKKHDPSVVVGNWTQEEDDLILKLFEVEGSNWTRISKHLPGRIPSSVKNRFYGTIRKKLPSHILERVAKRGKWQKLLNAVDSEAVDESESLLNSASQSLNSLSLESRTSLTEDERRERLQVLQTRMQSLEVFLNHTKSQIQRLEDEVI
mmetsp:Transcript_3760/g.8018  ORF Transcript_3760/g.8018 Transcript_3760/m.8018 type:complete len:276 (+) Transcript_3760:1049-1876(+)